MHPLGNLIISACKAQASGRSDLVQIKAYLKHMHLEFWIIQ